MPASTSVPALALLAVVAVVVLLPVPSTAYHHITFVAKWPNGTVITRPTACQAAFEDHDVRVKLNWGLGFPDIDGNGLGNQSQMGSHVKICWGDYTGRNFTDYKISAPWQIRRLKVEKRKVGRLEPLSDCYKFNTAVINSTKLSVVSIGSARECHLLCEFFGDSCGRWSFWGLGGVQKRLTCQLFVPGGSLEQETNGVVTGPRECPAATYEKPYKSWMDIFKQK